MTWAVFYRAPEHRRFDTTSTLSHAILDDPAFSPDPRSHPHYPLTDARSYKALPSKSPPRTSLPSQSCGSLSPPSTHPKLILKPPSSIPVPEILPKSDSTDTLAKLKPVASRNTNISRKVKMKALVRRLTSPHNLDRIDELDETDPFGGSYHHDGPYEAIGGNLVQPSLHDTVFRGTKRREIHPHPLRPGPHQSASRAPSAHSRTGLSLNLEPGQILRQNTIYSAHASALSQSRPQPNTTITRPDHSRSSSLPNVQTRCTDNSSSLEIFNGFHNRPPSSSLHAHRERYFRDNAPDIPSSLPLHHDRDPAPYVPETTVFPPPRYESRFHSLGPPQLSQCTTQPSLNAMPRKTQTTENTTSTLPPYSPQHQTVRSLDGSYQPNSTTTQSSSGVQNKPLEPLRIRHLPKRLVMPALLQPQPPQPLHEFPPAEFAAWQDGYLDDHSLEGAHFEGRPGMCTREPRLLRKRSSAFPAKAPIPDHAQNDDMPKMGNSPTKTANEAEGAKERTRRRRLSKRKNDI